MKCPGQDSRYWSGEDVFESDCPHCGHSVEFFKDDSQQKCRKCGHRMLNPKMDFGCASYCPHAEQCLGSMPPELVAAQGDLFKDRVGLAMRKYFGEDSRRIQHALDVTSHAEIIGKQEETADMMVIMAAALLHDIGIKNAELKYNSSSAKYQHIEGPPVAEKILEELKAPQELIEEVCDIIGHHHWPRDEETINFKVLYDADLIVNMIELYQDQPHTKKQLDELAASSFMTEAGAVQGKKTLIQLIQ
ncbi:MAG: phosphohydrolase [Desulfobulbus sp.]|nr:MAG: phosphohydrolase [Desulfobulbus sp.]